MDFLELISGQRRPDRKIRVMGIREVGNGFRIELQAVENGNVIERELIASNLDELLGTVEAFFRGQQ
jgi:hypothetical protein